MSNILLCKYKIPTVIKGVLESYKILEEKHLFLLHVLKVVMKDTPRQHEGVPICLGVKNVCTSRRSGAGSEAMLLPSWSMKLGTIKKRDRYILPQERMS